MLFFYIATVLLSPFIAFVMAIYRFTHKHYYFSACIIALALALFCRYYPPVGDQYRYWLMLDDFDPEQVLADIKNYNSVIALVYVCNIFNISLETLRSCLVFLMFLLAFTVIIDILKQNNANLTSRKILFVLSIFLCFFPFWHIVYGFRWGCAAVFLATGLYWGIFRKRWIVGGLLGIAAIVTHFASVMAVVLILFFYWINIKSKFGVIIFCASFLLVGELIIHLGLTTLFPGWDVLDAYVNSDAYWKSGFLSDLNIYGVLMHYIVKLPLWLYLLYLLIAWEQNKTELTRLVLAGIMSVALVSSFGTMYSRFSVLVLLLIAFDFSTTALKSEMIFRKYAKFIVMLAICYIFTKSYSLRHQRIPQNEVKFLVAPLWSSATFSYDDNFVKRYVDDDGIFYKELL